MTKQQVAALVGISLRTLSIYLKEGLINPRQVPGKKRWAYDFSPEDVERVRQVYQLRKESFAQSWGPKAMKKHRQYGKP